MAHVNGSSVLVLGGLGMVGMAVCRRVVEQHPAKLVVSALHNPREEAAWSALRDEFPDAPLEVEWGNVFVRESLKDLNFAEILDDRTLRSQLIADLLGELSGAPGAEILQKSTLHQLILRHSPHIVVDCINTATIFAYQDIYKSANQLLVALKENDGDASGDSGDVAPLDHLAHVQAAAEYHLSVLYIPALVRHMQILFAATSQNANRAVYKEGAEIYVKVGTTGTGGLGFNIPYTHGEDQPSRMLLSKSAMAGAHTLLLFLMGRTPGAPIVKEVKPAAAVAWARIEHGAVPRGGRAISLQDCPPEAGMRLQFGQRFEVQAMRGFELEREEKPLISVFVDTGENGVFAREEFATITSLGQMEFVTPEDIAEVVVQEIKGGNTGHDIVAALDSAVLGPSYRAGVARSRVLNRMDHLCQEFGEDSIAFELLGPPRLSKLLFEGWLLKQCLGDMRSIINCAPEVLSQRLDDRVRKFKGVRQQMISVGIPILLSDGMSLLCGDVVKVPDTKAAPQITPESLEQWTYQGWVDLRPVEMARWQDWLQRILDESEREVSSALTGSQYARQFADQGAWQGDSIMKVGEVVAWIFNNVQGGQRAKG